MKDFMFITSKLSSHTFRITDLAGSSCFLIAGKDYAVLVDAGTGLGNIRKCTESLTDKEIKVVLTHGHTDHIGGAALFDIVYISAEDMELAGRNDNQESKLFSASYTNPAVCRELVKEDMCPSSGRPFAILKKHKVFDLGDVVLETIPVPGHTKGFVMILNHTERYIIFGDGLNSAVFLLGTDASDIQTYRNSLLELKQYENLYDRCFVSHGPLLVKKEVLDGTLDVCNEMLKGKTERQKYTYAGIPCFFAHKVNEALERIDGGTGNILYTEDKIIV